MKKISFEDFKNAKVGHEFFCMKFSTELTVGQFLEVVNFSESLPDDIDLWVDKSNNHKIETIAAVKTKLTNLADLEGATLVVLINGSEFLEWLSDFVVRMKNDKGYISDEFNKESIKVVNTLIELFPDNIVSNEPDPDLGKTLNKDWEDLANEIGYAS